MLELVDIKTIATAVVTAVLGWIGSRWNERRKQIKFISSDTESYSRVVYSDRVSNEHLVTDKGAVESRKVRRFDQCFSPFAGVISLSEKGTILIAGSNQTCRIYGAQPVVNHNTVVRPGDCVGFANADFFGSYIVSFSIVEHEDEKLV